MKTVALCLAIFLTFTAIAIAIVGVYPGFSGFLVGDNKESNFVDVTADIPSHEEEKETANQLAKAADPDKAPIEQVISSKTTPTTQPVSGSGYAVGVSGSSGGSSSSGGGGSPSLPAQTESQSGGSNSLKIHKELKAGIDSLLQADPEGKIEVVISAKDQEQILKLLEEIKLKGGDIKAEVRTGNLIFAQIPANQVDSLKAGITAYPNREVEALLDDKIGGTGVFSGLGVLDEIGFDGKGVKIAVLDTGIDQGSEVLKGKVINSISFAGGDASDRLGHGTQVAGIAAGRKSLDGKYSGVAPAAEILNAKVLDDAGRGTTASVIQGINWAVGQGADIIVMSFSGKYDDLEDPINIAVSDAAKKGVSVVAASGNCGEGCPNIKCGDFKGVGVPGNNPNAITVGAVDQQNSWACFSGGGEKQGIIKPDITAIGVDVVAPSLGGFSTVTGTSASAPYAAGAAALLLQQYPELTPEITKSIIEESSLDLGVAGKDIKYGSGLVDIKSSLGPNKGSSIDLLLEKAIPGPAGIAAEVYGGISESNGIQGEGNITADSSCLSSDYPMLCGGFCWGGCPSGTVIQCNPNIGQATCCPSNYPLFCGRSCWGGCPSGTSIKCNPWTGNAYCESINKCAEGWTCKDSNTQGFKFSDCSWWGTTYYCPNGCDSGTGLCRPKPEYVSIEYPTEILPDGTATIKITYRSSGGYTKNAFISPSFSNDWDIIEYFGDLPNKKIYLKGDPIYKSGSNTQTPAEYTLIDFWGGWGGGETRTFTVKIKPKATGNLWFNVRAAFCDSSLNCLRDPNSGTGTQDQQNYFVYKKQINLKCISTSHATSACSDNDVYWYTSCNQREDKRDECGSSGCDSWGPNSCSSDGGKVVRTRACYDRGCSSGSCYSSTQTQAEDVETCRYGCENGKCLELPDLSISPEDIIIERV